MSIASSSSSFSYIKFQISSSQPSVSSCSSSTTSAFRFSTFKCTSLTIRSSQIDGSNLRKPLAPSPPPTSTAPLKPVPPSSPAAAPPPKPVAVEEWKKGIITLEFQRQKAKDLQEYFKQKKLDEADQGPFFGFIAKNEISNGRWAMFGFAVGMLTEYATGSDFVHQLQILLSNFGILDLQ